MARRWSSRRSSTSWTSTRPNDAHAEIAIAAARAGKHVLCEKPLAPTLAESQKMLEAVRKAGVRHMIVFNYRRVPAIAYAKQIIEAGQLGEIRHFRGTYLQDWLADPKFPMNWRLRKERAGSGALGDLNAHVVDLARYLVGEIAEVVGMQETFIKERPREEKAAGWPIARQRHGKSHGGRLLGLSREIRARQRRRGGRVRHPGGHAARGGPQELQSF